MKCLFIQKTLLFSSLFRIVWSALMSFGGVASIWKKNNNNNNNLCGLLWCLLVVSLRIDSSFSYVCVGLFWFVVCLFCGPLGCLLRMWCLFRVIASVLWVCDVGLLWFILCLFCVYLFCGLLWCLLQHFFRVASRCFCFMRLSTQEVSTHCNTWVPTHCNTYKSIPSPQYVQMKYPLTAIPEQRHTSEETHDKSKDAFKKDTRWTERELQTSKETTLQTNTREAPTWCCSTRCRTWAGATQGSRCRQPEQRRDPLRVSACWTQWRR